MLYTVLGKGVEKNEIKAFKYYEILAKQEIADAQLQLGNCFYCGIGTKIDKEQAFCWYKKAFINGNIIAKDILKQNYNKKIKIGKNKNKATQLQKILNLKGLIQLGLYFIGKLLIKASYEKAFYYFQKAAENGYKVAQHNLGLCYRDGIGVKKNEKIAFELFKKSAEQDYIDGKFRLGYCYHKGIGTNINKAKAIDLYKIVAKKGYSKTQNNLALLYKKGDGIEKNVEKAFYWYRKAAENGNFKAQITLQYCMKMVKEQKRI